MSYANRVRATDMGFERELRAGTPADKSTLEKMKGWHRRMHEAGYLALSWPKEYGGQRLDPVRQAIVNEEMCGRAPGPIGGG